MLCKPQRLSRKGVEPSGSKWWTLRTAGEDIVWSPGKPGAAGQAAGGELASPSEHKTKRLPFRNKFQTHVITDPYQIYEAFEHAQGNKDYDGIVIDTLTFLMDMFESLYIVGNSNTQKAWGDYAQFFKNLMQVHVASSDKSVIFLGHTKAEYNEKTLTYDTAVPVKGSLKNNGIEAFEESALAA